MAKKPPTYGQKPYDEKAIVPPSEWEPIQDLTHLQNYDGILMAGNTSQRAISVARQFLSPVQVDSYTRWARMNPTMDPRAWLPLGEGGIDPNSQAGKDISLAAKVDEVNNVRDVAIGSREQVKPTASWMGTSDVFSKTSIPPQQQAPEPGPLEKFITGAYEGTVGALQTVARGVQDVFQSSWDLLQAGPRTAAGLSEAQQKIADKYGLTPDEAVIAFPVSGPVQALAGKDLRPDTQATDSEGKITRGALSGFSHMMGAQASGVDPSTLPDDRKALIKQAQDEWNASAPAQVGNIVSSLANQTPVGQIIKDPSLLTNDTGWTAANPELLKRTEAASIEAYDMRTADEIARGVKPIGWTPGRGIAHVAWSPDEQAFHTWSGVIDFTSNLTMDPVNAIPVGAFGRVGEKAAGGVASLAEAMGKDSSRIPGALNRAMQRGQEKIGVQTTGAAFTADEVAALTQHTTVKSNRMNQALRGVGAAPSKPLAARSAALDSLATKTALDAGGVVYRGIKDASELPTRKGRIITDKGFAATTKSADEAIGYAGKGGKVLAITVPEGAAGIDVAKVLGKESGDFILPRGSKFKIDRIDGNVIHVTLRNPKQATGSISGGFAAARASARGDALLGDLTDQGIVSKRVADEVLWPDGSKENLVNGLVTGPHANIIVGERTWGFLNSGRGKAIVNDLVNETSAARIILRSNRKIDADLAQTLAKATTPEEVRAALGTRLGFDLNDPRSLRNFGSSRPGIFKNLALSDNPVMGFLRKAPHARPFDLEDVDNTFTQIERFGRGARMKFDDVEPHLNKIIEAGGDPVAVYQAIYGGERLGPNGLEKVPGFLDAVADHLAADAGIEKADAHRLTRAFQGGLDEALRNYINTGIADAMGSSVDGAVGSALLDSELLTRAAVLPDYRMIREASGAFGRFRNHFVGEDLNEKTTRYVNSVTSAWKSSVLLRPAYVFREIGEMAVAASLAGYSSIFTEPVAMLGLVLATVAQKEAATSAGRLAKALTAAEMPAKHFDRLSEKAASGGVGTKVGVATRKAGYQVAGVPARLAHLVHLQAGMHLLFPALDDKWARANGEGLFDAMNRYTDTGDASEIDKWYYGFSAISGNFNVDERGMGRAVAKNVHIATQDDLTARPHYINGLVDKLAAMAADGDMRNLANPDIDFRRAVELFQKSGRRDRKATAGAKNFAGKSDEQYLQGYADLLQKITGGDEELMLAIAKGQFAGGPIHQSNKSLRAHIEGLLDDPGMAASLPPTMRYLEMDREFKFRVSNAVSAFFDMTGETSDLLARAPLFRQAYVKETRDLVKDMNPAAKAEMVANLRRAGAVKEALEIQAIPAKGTLHWQEVDALAGKFARDEQARIFYDAHERQNYAVAIRAIMPFAQATFNTIRRWGELSMRNPQLMYRTLKPLNYAMQPGAASIYGSLGALYGQETSTALFDPATYGWDTPDNRHNRADGFFYTDSYGDRKFSYPLIGKIGELVGVPAAAMNESNLSGLNVAGTSIQPGFGPAITLAATFLGGQDVIDRADTTGDVMRFLFPYSLPDGNIPTEIVGAFAPSWLQKVMSSSNEDSVANLAMKVMPVLKDSGRYDLASEADQRQLATDASTLAERLFRWNAFMGSITPSTINTKTLVEDPSDRAGYRPSDGGKIVDAILKNDAEDKAGNARRWIIQDKLNQEWDRYTQATGGKQAYRDGMLNFVHDYGASALLSVIPRTQGAGNETIPQATNDVWHFRTDEPATYDHYSDVIGLFFAGGSAFVPNASDPQAFASPLYQAQTKTGEREVRTPDEFIRAAMNEYGWMLYNPKKLEIEQSGMSTDEKRAANQQVKDDITALTKGAWTGQGLDLGKTVRLMSRLGEAVNDPTVQTLKSAPYIKSYMDKRADLIEQMKAKGVRADFSTKQNQDYAVQLIDHAKNLMRQDPTGAFNNAWNRLFINEFGS